MPYVLIQPPTYCYFADLRLSAKSLLGESWVNSESNDIVSAKLGSLIQSFNAVKFKCLSW